MDQAQYNLLNKKEHFGWDQDQKGWALNVEGV